MAGQCTFTKVTFELSFIKRNRSGRGAMKNSQQRLELTVLHIIKNEEKAVDSNSLGIVGGEKVYKIAGDAHFLPHIFM